MSKRPQVDGDVSVAKKQKSDASQANGSSVLPVLSKEDLINQKRAEIQAKMAAMTGKQPSFPIATGQTSTSRIVAPTPVLPSSDDIRRRIEEARKLKRVAEASSLLANKDNPYLNHTAGKKKASGSATPAPEPAGPQGSGLKMAAHPLLLDNTVPAPQSKKDKYKPLQPKFASIRANVRTTPTATPPPVTPSPALDMANRANPYAGGTQANAKDPTASGSFEGAAPKDRVSRQLKFNPKGKHIALANQMRKEEQMEALKQRIAENARKAGLGGEFESVERAIRRGAPPSAEWWDESLLPNKTYDDITTGAGMSSTKIRATDSPITLYIQHPIKIHGDSSGVGAVELKPLMLTTKERKKMRKQRRAAELQDRRDRIRMGLIPPDAPKVRLANLMKVLTTDAVQDPTRVEARVRREVAVRKHNHEKANAERKLTDEQRRAKVEAKKVEEDRKGLVGATFRVKNLSDPSHRFKVRKNAEQLGLTGVALVHADLSVVYVEGASKFMRRYLKLMQQRIQWTEPARARDEEEVEQEGNEDEAGEASGSNRASGSGEYMVNFGSGGDAGDLADNRCDLIWEGMLRERAFPSFRIRPVATDGAAREALGTKLAGIWDQCKNWRPEEVDYV